MNLKRLVIWSIIGTGISSVTTQLLTLREFLTQFHGNEITISLVLFSWLILTGIGSFAAKLFNKASPALFGLLSFIASVLPLAQIIAARMIRESFFIHGTSPGFYPVLLYIFIIITPYCLITGFILPFSQKLINSENNEYNSGELYLTDNTGDISGGALFSFVLVYFLKPFSIIAITSTLLIITSLSILAVTKKFFMLSVSIVITALFYLYSLNPDFEKNTLFSQYGEIMTYMETPYGRLVISREYDQQTFWESGIPLYSGSDIARNEEKVHYPLSQLKKIHNVLLISGGLGETLIEIQKHNPGHVDYVELDPYLTKAAIDSGILKKTALVDIINMDARLFVKETSRKYDAVIVDLPDPGTFQINRFFTSEFMKETKMILNKGGILSLSLEYSENYISEIRKKKLSTLYNTARKHFKNVLALPGEKAYFLCRDGEIKSGIPSMLAEKNIGTAYIAGFYEGNVTRERILELEESITHGDTVNTDFEPALIGFIFQEWFQTYGSSPRLFFIFIASAMLIYFLVIKREEYILFSTGFATMGVEMLIVYVFQILYGYVYLKIGGIITVFLLGLLPGALLGIKWKAGNRIKIIVSELLLLGLLAIFLVWAVWRRIEFDPSWLYVYSFAYSFLCGFQFPVITDILGEKNSPAAGCLTADLSGASLGTLITGTLLIPLYGIKTAAFFLLIIKISSNMLTMFTEKTDYIKH